MVITSGQSLDIRNASENGQTNNRVSISIYSKFVLALGFPNYLNYPSHFLRLIYCFRGFLSFTKFRVTHIQMGIIQLKKQ